MKVLHLPGEEYEPVTWKSLLKGVQKAISSVGEGLGLITVTVKFLSIILGTLSVI